MKRSRHEEILSLIMRYDIETQEELAERLRTAGFAATQATVSRDIRELNLIKLSAGEGRQKYVAISGKQAQRDNLSDFIKDSIKSVDDAGNLLVIKTLTGMGMAVAVNIDSAEIPEIVGTIAGDDVVFCAIKSLDRMQHIKDMFIGKG